MLPIIIDIFVTTNKIMSFAVVRFLNECNTNDVVVSEVPISWLSKDYKECKWPPNNSNIYISKNRPASDSWPTYQVEVEFVCDTLAEAKLKAQSCSSDEEGKIRGKGCRAPKPLKVYSPESSPRRKGANAPSLPSVMEDGYVDYFLKKFPTAVPVDDQQCEDDSEKGYESNAIDLENVSETPISDLDILSLPQMMKASKATQTENLDLATNVDLGPLLDSIIRTQVEHSICLQEIKQMIVKEGQESEVEKVSFNFNLPCDSLETLESLETYVHAHSSQFIKFLQKIGGNDGRDFTCRCMKTIFTNSLGEICSWTGQKSNYAVSNLKFMELMFDVVHKKSFITKKDFEFYAKEWFRHSKQRRERDDKRKGK